VASVCAACAATVRGLDGVTRLFDPVDPARGTLVLRASAIRRAVRIACAEKIRPKLFNCKNFLRSRGFGPRGVRGVRRTSSARVSMRPEGKRNKTCAIKVTGGWGLTCETPSPVPHWRPAESMARLARILVELSKNRLEPFGAVVGTDRRERCSAPRQSGQGR